MIVKYYIENFNVKILGKETIRQCYLTYIRYPVIIRVHYFRAEAERMRMKASAYKQYGDAAILALVLEALPQIAAEVSLANFPPSIWRIFRLGENIIFLYLLGIEIYYYIKMKIN